MFSENSQNIFKNPLNVETIIVIDQLVYHSAVGGRSGQSRPSDSRRVGSLISRSVGQSVGRSVSRSVSQLVGRSVSRLVGRPVSHSMT